jgi:hypothetical protein
MYIPEISHNICEKKEIEISTAEIPPKLREESRLIFEYKNLPPAPSPPPPLHFFNRISLFLLQIDCRMCRREIKASFRDKNVDCCVFKKLPFL